jgi:hypothetical protein
VLVVELFGVVLGVLLFTGMPVKMLAAVTDLKIIIK